MALEFFSRAQPASVAEQAAEWLVEFEAGPLSDAQRRAFVAWLKRSPVHIEEFLQLSAIHAQLGTAPALQDSLEDILAEMDGTVVEIVAREQQAEARAPSRRRAGQKIAMAASVVIVLLGVVLASLWVVDRGEQVYRTGFGEQRSIPLADGTVLTLNTDSEVRVQLSETLRSARLISGEVMFDVAKDAARPFEVAAGPIDVHVVGTRFNIYRQDARTTLTVLEGKVDVAPAETTAAAVPDLKTPRRIEAGGQLVVAATGQVIAPPQPNVERAAAWTARRVIFDNEPLSNVLVEFNRYNNRRLSVADPQLAQRKVSGVFKVHDVDVLIAFLQQQHDIRIVRDGNEVQIAPIH